MMWYRGQGDLHPAPLNPDSGPVAFPPRVLGHISVLTCDMELVLWWSNKKKRVFCQISDMTDYDTPLFLCQWEGRDAASVNQPSAEYKIPLKSRAVEMQ